MHLINHTSKVRSFTLFMLLSTLCMAMTGCKGFQSILGEERPSARITDARLTSLNMEEAGVDLDLVISNPYDIGVPLTDLQYQIEAKNLEILNGKMDSAGTVIPANGSKQLTIPVVVNLPKTVELLSNVQLGEVLPYKAGITLSLDLPTGNALELPLSKTGELPIPNVPDVEIVNIQWSKLTIQNAGASMNMKVTNTNQFPLKINDLGYQLTLAEQDISNSNLKMTEWLQPGESRELSTSFNIKPIQFGLAFFNILTGAESKYSLKGVIQADTPYKVPLGYTYEKTGVTPFLK